MKKFVVIPTYKEESNIAPLIEKILALGISDLTVLVVDDHSPDQTGAEVLKIAKNHPNIILIERIGEKGRGTAGVVGFDLALQWGADQIVEMDADFSHDPRDLPRIFSALENADIVIASRLVEGSIDARPKSRRIITRFSNLYARIILERKEHKSVVTDWTSGFRGYRKEVFEKIIPSSLISNGPSILQEILYRALNLGFTAKEIPFEMVDRTRGVSSFNSKIALQGLLLIAAFRWIWNRTDREFFLGGFSANKMTGGHFQIKSIPFEALRSKTPKIDIV